MLLQQGDTIDHAISVDQMFRALLCKVCLLVILVMEQGRISYPREGIDEQQFNKTRRMEECHGGIGDTFRVLGVRWIRGTDRFFVIKQ
jgi:hypothetical protein